MIFFFRTILYVFIPCIFITFFYNCIRQKPNSFPSSETVGECPVENLGVINQDAPDQVIVSLIFQVTAYCPCEICCGIWAEKGYNKNGNRITSSGHIIKPNDKFVASHPAFPFDMRMNIPGYGLVEIKDRGGSLDLFNLDVFFPTHQEAKEWGVKYLEVPFVFSSMNEYAKFSVKMDIAFKYWDWHLWEEFEKRQKEILDY